MLVQKPPDVQGPKSTVRHDVLKALTPATPLIPARRSKKAVSTPEVDGNISSGSVKIHSSSRPHLLGQQKYKITIEQDIQTSQDNAAAFRQGDLLTSSRSFFVDESPWSLDPTSIHSVYPPPGHADYSNVLPHVTLNDPSIPWSIQPVSDGSESSFPWLALLTFSDDELSRHPGSVTSIINSNNATKTPTGAVSLSIKDLAAASSSGDFLTPRTFNDSDKANPSLVQNIFVDGSLFAHYFAPSTPGRPSLRRFGRMSHVRTVNSAGMTNRSANGEEAFSMVIGPRAGPLNNSAPEVVHAHLISLYGLVENIQHVADVVKPVALPSLHSWSYMSLPAGGQSLTELMQGLSKNIQPFRLPDPQVLTREPTPSASIDDWTKNRMLAGYSIIEHDTIQGAPTYALHRGPLTPFKCQEIDFPPSDFGHDLAIVDPVTGILDLTYQMAWNLGRTLISSNQATTAALTRLRAACHGEALKKAKTLEASKLSSSDAGHIHKADALQTLQSTVQSISNLQISSQLFSSDRWPKHDSLDGKTRNNFLLSSPTVLQNYRNHLQDPKASFSRRVAESSTAPQAARSRSDDETDHDGYTEVNKPNSTDYAQLLAWCNDAWYFDGIPYHYLLPDPMFVPHESIRTFYVDPAWFKVFFDGALSITEHFTPDDDVREAIKLNLDDYLTSPLSRNVAKPPLPRWGFFIRSELITKFADMRISAPRNSGDPAFRSGLPDCLRKATISNDLVMALFDREPTADNFPEGITIHGPEHQICSMLGEIGDLTTKELKITWKHATDINLVDAKLSNLNNVQNSLVLSRPSNGARPSDVFDFDTRLLQPDMLAALAAANISSDSEPPLSLLDRTGWKARADSYEQIDMSDPDYPLPHPPSNVLDGRDDTRWNTQWVDPITTGSTDGPPLPHWIEIDMGKSQTVAGLLYRLRQDGSFDGVIGRYEVYTSGDGNFSSQPATSGQWSCSRNDKFAFFTPVNCRFVRLQALSDAQDNGNQKTSCAELHLLRDNGFSSSLLASQLLSITPKVTIECTEKPQMVQQHPAKFTTSKARPSTAVSQQVQSLAAKASPDFVALTTPASRTAASLTPCLAALGRVEIDLDWKSDQDLWRRLSQLIGINNVRWDRYNSRSNVPEGPLLPNLSINIYNIRTINGPDFKRPSIGLLACRPQSYGFRTDVYFSARRAENLTPSGNLTSLEVVIPLSSSSTLPLLLDLAGGHLPAVRMISGSRRWIVGSTSLRADGFLVIRIEPNKGDPSEPNLYKAGRYVQMESSDPADLSFVVPDVQLCCPERGQGDQRYVDVGVTETYVVSEDGRTEVAGGTVGQYVTCLDVDSNP